MKLVGIFILLGLSTFFKPNVDKDAFLTEVNKIRAEGCKCGEKYYQSVNPVIWNEILAHTAYLHSKNMSDSNHFSHIEKNGSTPADRLKRQKYFYRSFAENIFQAIDYTPTPKEVVLAWKNSPSHCKNLMSPDYVEMGIGEYNGYYTQLFGKR